MVPSNVAAQAVGLSAPGVGANDWSEEPNVLASGSVPSNPYGDVSGNYPADANGLPSAFAGEAPALVLQAKWMPYLWPMTTTLGTLSGTGLAGVVNPDSGHLLRPFVGRDFILPGTESSFLAFYGEWADYNGDKIRNDEGHWRNSVDGHDRPIYVRGNPNDACTQHDPNVAPGGETTFAGGQPGNTLPVGVTVPLTIENRCTTQDEWNPPPGWSTTGAANPEVVTYVSPGSYFSFSGPVLVRPCPVPGLDRSPDDCADEPAQQAPDITYTPGDFYGQGTYSWEFVFDVTLDGSMLETKVTETISEPLSIADGPRTREAGDASRTDGRPASLVDVDLYSSVDPAVEAIFQDTLHNGIERPVNDLTGSQDPAARALFDQWVAVTEAANEVLGDVTGGATCHPDPLEAVACVVDPQVGPTMVGFVGRREVEQTGFDHTEGFHLYMDLNLHEAFHVALVLTSFNTWLTDVCTGSASSCGPAVGVAVGGNFGAWYDDDADGFIGNSEEMRTRTCPDAYDCGTVSDPHQYSDDDSDGEFLPTCAPGRSGAFQITLTPDGGRWGDNGAYLLYDEGSNVESTQGGRANFNPYDDVALDAADGQVSRLYTTGPVRMFMTCVGGSGVYDSFEGLYLLDGRTYGITMQSDPVTMAFTAAGITTPETVTDRDYLPAFDL